MKKPKFIAWICDKNFINSLCQACTVYYFIIVFYVIRFVRIDPELSGNESFIQTTLALLKAMFANPIVKTMYELGAIWLLALIVLTIIANKGVKK